MRKLLLIFFYGFILTHQACAQTSSFLTQYQTAPGVNTAVSSSTPLPVSVSIGSGGIVGVLPVANGGTGATSLGCGLTNAGNVFNTSQCPESIVSTSTYPVTSTNAGMIVRFNSSTSIAASIAAASTTGLTQGFSFWEKNTGTANAVLTPSVSTINGQSSLTLLPGQGCYIYSDSTNYQVEYADCDAITKIFPQLGIGTTPTQAIGLNGNVANTIWSERNTTTIGQNLTIQAGGALPLGTNLNGGVLDLNGGVSTGTGTSGVNVGVYPAGVSGTADNSVLNVMSFSVVGASSSFIQMNSGATLKWQNRASLQSPSDEVLTIGNSAATIKSSLAVPAGNTVQLGGLDAAAPAAQTLSVQNVASGTSNIAGQNFTINASVGTGTALPGKIIFQNALPGTTGTTPNTLAPILTLSAGGDLQLAGAAPTSNAGSVATGSTSNKGQITGLSAATSLTITFNVNAPLSTAPACSFSGSAALVSPFISISPTAVTITMTAFTGTLYYVCF